MLVMILAESGSGTAALIVAIGGAITALGTVYGLWRTNRLKARTDAADVKLRETDSIIKGVEVTNASFERALKQYETDNARLRIEVESQAKHIREQDARIDELESSRDELRREVVTRDAECARQLDELRSQLDRLGGQK